MNELQLPEQNQDGVTALEQARAFQVFDAVSFKSADEMAVALKQLEKQVDELFDEHIDRAYQAHKALTTKKKGFAAPIIEARGLLKNKMFFWQQEQERERRAKELELQAQANRLAEEQQLAEAELAEKSGDKEAAQEIINRPVEAAVVVLSKAAPKAKTVLRTVPDQAKIEAAIVAGVRDIPGVHVWQAWQFKVLEAAKVPEKYRRPA